MLHLRSYTKHRRNTVHTRYIFVLPAGWVLVGTIDSVSEGRVHLSDAKVIRRWGTTNGLAQLALDGPTSDTCLEPATFASFPEGSDLFRLRVMSDM